MRAWEPKDLPEAISATIAIHQFLRRNGIRDLTGDYGELIAHGTIGGTLRPPVSQGYDIDHPDWGRVQVKTRRLGSRLGERPSNETRAVFRGALDFDHLFHIILDDSFQVRDAFLAPLSEVECVVAANSRKISIAQTKALASAVDFTREADEAERRFRARFA